MSVGHLIGDRVSPNCFNTWPLSCDSQNETWTKSELDGELPAHLGWYIRVIHLPQQIFFKLTLSLAPRGEGNLRSAKQGRRRSQIIIKSQCAWDFKNFVPKWKQPTRGIFLANSGSIAIEPKEETPLWHENVYFAILLGHYSSPRVACKFRTVL